MNATLLKVQLAALGVLSVILLAEWGFAESSQKDLQDTLKRTLTSEYRSEPLPALNLPKQAAESFTAIIERPMFIEGRRPFPEAAPENAEDGADTSQLDDWVLIGIYNKDKKDVALFRKQNEAKTYLKLNEAQTISGWQLTEIQSDRVVLQLGGQNKTVMLRKPRQQLPPRAPRKRPAPPAKPGIPRALPHNHNPSENKENDG